VILISHIGIREQTVAELVVIVPSRGRPRSIAALAQDFAATAGPEARMVVAVDNDDPELAAYQRLPLWDMPQFHLREGGRLRLGGTLNEVAAEYVGFYDVIGFMGDDHRPRTDGWALEVLTEMKWPGAGIVYGNDLLQRDQLPTAVFMRPAIIKALGWMALPGLVHLYIDNVWLELGRATGQLRYLPNVVIEHMHPAAGKAQRDAGYDEVNAPALDAADKAVFERWRTEQLAADVERLRAAGIC
jgi:hypothetical protein